ncbi:polyhydroxyalkanoate granule-associated phasin [Piscinibacter sp. XHJ-5]|uniref:polyhydroxyalkanoate granule-associated phasin n=1 Tax=Piscinibacter sp. XHJ-5 TaxID=3037797 RepID=UPI0024531A0D|nr:polyhydroxyalkanoate granule-associated phasin [Piscinibacter sp. XHJ-5]
MPRKPRLPVAPVPFVLWNDLALRTGEMLTSSAQVIAHRTGRMAAAGHSPNARDRREFTRMGLEKVEAAGESLWAMGQQIAQMNTRLAMKAWQDAVAAGTAWMSMAGSRTLPQLMQRQVALAKSVSASAKSAERMSDATARVAKHGLKPIHSRATANAKRLGRR